MDKDIESLEKLLLEARAQARAKPASPVQRSSALAARHRAHFTDPTNWSLTQQVQLVHREDNVETLVGLFDEYIHVYTPGARRLVAAQLAPEMKPKVEYVQGDHWIGRQLEVKRRAPDQTVRIIEDLILDCGPAAPTVEISCSIVGGGVARACLVRGTAFVSSIPRTILLLPAGMDVLEGLTRDTKERIWEEVQKELDGENGLGR